MDVDHRPVTAHQFPDLVLAAIDAAAEHAARTAARDVLDAAAVTLTNLPVDGDGAVEAEMLADIRHLAHGEATHRRVSGNASSPRWRRCDAMAAPGPATIPTPHQTAPLAAAHRSRLCTRR